MTSGRARKKLWVSVPPPLQSITIFADPSIVLHLAQTSSFKSSPNRTRVDLLTPSHGRTTRSEREKSFWASERMRKPRSSNSQVCSPFLRAARPQIDPSLLDCSLEQPVKLVPEGFSLFGQPHGTIQSLSNGFKSWYGANMKRRAAGGGGKTPGYPGAAGARTPFAGASSHYRANPSSRTPLPGAGGSFAGGRTPIPGAGYAAAGGRTPLGGAGFGQGAAGGYGGH